jgi:enoyl-CoA hydratase
VVSSMYQYENLLVSTSEDGITTVTINRPKFLNALDIQTLQEMEDAFEKLATDPNTRSMIIRGGGEKAFVAGADLKAMSTMTAVEGRNFSILGHEVFDAIEKLPYVVIAAVNGYALGGGCELALACDFRFGSTTAKFGQPEVNYGIIPGFGGSQRLARLIGKGYAKEMIYTGDMINAEEAYRLGLINRILPPEELIPACEEVCRKIMKKGPLAIASAKDAIDRGLKMDLDSGLSYEAQVFGNCFATLDQKEGMKAFLEKRKPVFMNK